jgi:hypothetical protein
MAIEEPIDQVQIARAAASGAYGEFARQLRLSAGGKGRDFFVPDGNPLDLIAHAQRFGDAIERITHQSIDTAHIGGFEDLDYSVGNIGHLKPPLCVAKKWRRKHYRICYCATEMILPQPIVDVHLPSGEAMMTMDRWQSAQAAQEFSMSGMIFPISIA